MTDVKTLQNTTEDSISHLSSWRLAVVIGSLCLGTFLLALDMNIIGVAVPKITSDFHSLEDVAWYGSVYLLTVTAFQPLGGNLYKFFNTEIVYLSSIALFECESKPCIDLFWLTVSSWIRCMCHSSGPKYLDPWSSHLRGWRCGTSPRSPSYHRTCC